MLIRYCPRCRSEFQMQVMECLDCGGPLDVRDDEVPFEYPDLPPEPDEEEDDDDEKARPEHEPAIPRGTPAISLRVAAYSWILDLADALKKRDIPYVIAEVPEREDFRLFVRVEDGEAAAAIDREVFLAGLREDLPALPEERLGACPACGTDIPPGQVKCPECDLILAATEEEIEQVLEEERSLAEDEEPDEESDEEP